MDQVIWVILIRLLMVKTQENCHFWNDFQLFSKILDFVCWKCDWKI